MVGIPAPWAIVCCHEEEGPVLAVQGGHVRAVSTECLNSCKGLNTFFVFSSMYIKMLWINAPEVDDSGYMLGGPVQWELTDRG